MAKNLIDQEQEFLKELKALGSKIKNNLDKIKTLYSCEEKDFLTTAEDFIKKNKNNFQIKAYDEVIAAVESRKLKVSLSTIIIEKFQNDLKGSNNYSNQVSYISEWAKYLLNHNKEELQGFADKLVAVIKEKLIDVKKTARVNQYSPQQYFLSSTIQSLFAPCIATDIGSTLTLLNSLKKG